MKLAGDIKEKNQVYEVQICCSGSRVELMRLSSAVPRSSRASKQSALVPSGLSQEAL